MISVTNVKLDMSVLDKFAANFDGNVEKALAALALQAEGYAKTLAPVDTGALMNSIHTERQMRLVYWVMDGVEYGIYQELGTGRMSAHPFMIPAFENVSRDLAQAISNEVGK